MDQPDWDELERAGLFDPASPDAEERRALLLRYHERGVAIADMVAAAERGRLVTLLGDQGVRPGRDELTLLELAERVELPADLVRAALRASGLPAVPDDLPYFGQPEVELFEGFRLASSLFGTDNVLTFVRAVGTASSRVAAAAVTLASVTYSGLLERSGAPEVEISEANELTVVALQTVPNVMETLFRHHVEAEIRRSLLVEIEPGSRTVRLAVGFLDLVGFTTTVALLEADALAGTVSGFEALAGDVIAARGARLIKVIGDEVMFVTHDPADACRIALDVAEAIADSPTLNAVRGGLTYGEVIALDGDFYGTEVNLAARAVAAAEPGQILVTKEVARSDGFTFVPAGPHALKGFADPVDLFALSATSP